MPGQGPHDSARPDALTLVVAMQRSGSTLLGRDIESLGGLGVPREHFRGFGDQASRGGASTADVEERLAQGITEDVPGVTGLKLQVHQAVHVADALEGRHHTSVKDALSTVVSWAESRFDRLMLIVLVRNALDVAISRVMVKETGTYLSSKPRSPLPTAAAPLSVNLNPRILDELQAVVRQRAALQELAAERPDQTLLLTYDKLTNEVDATTERLLEHARRNGFEPRSERVVRTLEKLIPPEQADALRSSFLGYLASETGANS